MNNRTIVNERIRREIIGPGSDLFVCKPDFSNEIIGGKPLQRYFSGILFPKERQEDGSDTGQDTFSDDVETPEDQEVPPIQTTDEGQQEEPDIKPGNDDDDEDTALK